MCFLKRLHHAGEEFPPAIHPLAPTSEYFQEKASCIHDVTSPQPRTFHLFMFGEHAAEFSQELINNRAAAFRAEEKGKKKNN